MDSHKALDVARRVKAEKRRDKKDRDAYVEELTRQTCEELGCSPDDVSVTLLGTSGADHVIYVWDSDKRSANAYRFPLV